MKRYLSEYIGKDLHQKMVFLGGPRQVGKTTLSTMIGDELYQGNYTYLNRDAISHKRRILATEYDSDAELIIFDEIHKYDQRKNLVKGEYDTKKSMYAFMVTGSARLNIYQKGGDSMLGRYFYYRLHPYSFAETIKYHSNGGDIHRLLEYGGFPEAYELASTRNLQRWSNDRKTRIVREDIRDLTDIRDIGKLELLVSILESKVASPFSINSLVQDIGVTHKTVSHWIETLEYTYYCRRIYPRQSNRIKSLRKEPKLYLWDWSECNDLGAKIENMIGSHLLKWTHYQKDVFGEEYELMYVKEQGGREVDFLITHKKTPYQLIEVKKSDSSISKSLRYFHKRIQPAQTIQIVYECDRDYDRTSGDYRVVSAEKFLSQLI